MKRSYTDTDIIYHFDLCILDPYTIIWSQELNNIEVVAGMMAGGLALLERMNNLGSSKNRKNYYFYTDADTTKFRIIDSVPNTQIKHLSNETLINNNNYNYYVWLNSGNLYLYSLYGYNSSDFFQGILSICKACERDVRDIVYGFPFDNRGIRYEIDGYHEISNDVAQDAPDLDDVSEEEKDDENIIEPLKRDDDLI